MVSAMIERRKNFAAEARWWLTCWRWVDDDDDDEK